MSLAFASVAYWHWLALGGVLIIIEAFAPGFLFVWLGFAALAVGLALLVWPSLGLSLQLLLFAVLSVASMFAWRYWQGSRAPTSDHPHLNRRGAQYVGRRAVLADPIVNGRGRARLGDTSWQVTGPDLPAGRVVEVVGLDGTILEVAPAAAGEGRSETEAASPREETSTVGRGIETEAPPPP